MEDNRQELINSLKEDKQLKCPFCNGTRFRRESVCFCDMWERDGDSVCDEDISAEEYTYFCKNCGKDVTDAELK